jgi:HK97 family phage portal protein
MSGAGGPNPWRGIAAAVQRASWPVGTDVDSRVGVTRRTATDGRDILVNDPDGWEVHQPWIWWEGPPGDGDDDGGTGGPLGNPPPGAAGQLPLPVAVTRATSLIADTLAGMPWVVRRGRDKLETPAWLSDPQAKRRDLRIQAGPVPAWRRSGVEFWSWYITSMLWLGEGIAYVPNRNDDGSPAPPMWQLNPLFIDIEGPDYVIRGGQQVADELGGGFAPDYTFGPDELIVTRGLVRDGPRGVGVLQAHFWDLELAGLIRGYAANMLRAGVPQGYLKVNAPQLTKDKARDLQRGWMKAHGGPFKRIAVLNAVTEFHALGLDPQALQLAQMRDYSTADVALMFGVPAYMLNLAGAGTRDTYANVESRMIELRQFTLLPWARRVESTMDAEVPRGTDTKIGMDALLRADTLSRYQAHKIGIDAGFLLRDEAREYEDLSEQSEDVLAALAMSARGRIGGGSQ